jgi:hypothetical protein
MTVKREGNDGETGRDKVSGEVGLSGRSSFLPGEC